MERLFLKVEALSVLVREVSRTWWTLLRDLWGLSQRSWFVTPQDPPPYIGAEATGAGQREQGLV